jgi:peptidyl-dipeptidase Dcp
VVVNNLNIAKPPAGEPTLLTWDEVITMFHEFGHALHGLLSDVRYPSQSGTDVPRDFVEYPSQVNEMWAWEPEILRAYAVHHVTGDPMPQEWVETMLASRQFNEGFATTEYLAAALLDQAWYRLAPDEVPTEPDEVEAFEAAALERAGVAFGPVPPRYRTSYFNHVFGGGYSAGYYSYIWSEVLDADTVEWFAENGGLSRANGDTFRARLLGRGGSADAMDSFRDLRGRDPEITPLLKRRGLLAATTG